MAASSDDCSVAQQYRIQSKLSVSSVFQESYIHGRHLRLNVDERNEVTAPSLPTLACTLIALGALVAALLARACQQGGKAVTPRCVHASSRGFVRVRSRLRNCVRLSVRGALLLGLLGQCLPGGHSHGASAVAARVLPSASDRQPFTPILLSARSDDAEVIAPSPRWGHSAVYLKSSNIVLFVGGQVASNGKLTNDVYALDVSAMHDGVNSAKSPWSKLSSEGLPPHAFAAATTVTRSNSSSEQVMIIGGVTSDCHQDAPGYLWTPAESDDGRGWMNASWSAVNVPNSPIRRRGARAVQVSSSLAATSSSSDNSAPAVMVLGGRADSTTCYTGTRAAKKSNPNADYLGIDFWQFTQGQEPSKPSMETRPVAVDPNMTSLPLLNYAIARIPGKAQDGSEDKLAFIGGRDASGKYSAMNKFWVLDLKYGSWQHWKSAGTVPSGRAGHTASVTPDGRILLYGGYADGNGDGKSQPTSDVYVLDVNRTPAQWSLPKYASSGDSNAPARAFHSAVMAGDTLVVGFGVDKWQHGAQDGNPDGSLDLQHVYYLNTDGSKPWAWSQATSSGPIAQVNTLAAAGGSESQSSPQVTSATLDPTQDSSSPDSALQSGGNSLVPSSAATIGEPSADSVASADAPSQSPVSDPALPADNAQSPSADDIAPDATVAPSAAGSPLPVASDDASSQIPDASTSALAPTTTPAASGGPEQATSDPSGGKVFPTAAVVGGVLGAAAVAAVIAGLLMQRRHKRMQEEEAEFERDELWRKYNEEDGGPPVSALWLPASASASEAHGSKLHGSSEQSSPSEPSPVQPPLPPRSASLMKSSSQSRAALATSAAATKALPNSKLGSLPFILRQEDLLGSPSRLMRKLRREPSKESFGSIGNISHFSYPWLTGMHRRSLANLSSNPDLSATGRGSFEMATDAGSVSSRANGAPSSTAGSPFLAAKAIPRKPVPAVVVGPNPYDMHDEELLGDDDGAASHIAERGGAAGLDGVCPSPFFPWETSAAARTRSPFLATSSPVGLDFARRYKAQQLERLSTISAETLDSEGHLHAPSRHASIKRQAARNSDSGTGSSPNDSDYLTTAGDMLTDSDAASEDTFLSTAGLLKEEVLSREPSTRATSTPLQSSIPRAAEWIGQQRDGSESLGKRSSKSSLLHSASYKSLQSVASSSRSTPAPASSPSSASDSPRFLQERAMSAPEHGKRRKLPRSELADPSQTSTSQHDRDARKRAKREERSATRRSQSHIRGQQEAQAHARRSAASRRISVSKSQPGVLTITNGISSAASDG